MRVFRERLFARIFLTYIMMIVIWTITLFFVNNVLLISAFRRNIDNTSAAVMELREAVNRGRENIVALILERLFPPFRRAVNDALRLALLVAFFTTAVASAFISQQLVAPVQRMTEAAQRIATGHYSERVSLPPNRSEEELDELDRLAYHFNQMAASLEQTENRRRQLIGDVAHELRTPLTIIKGSMEALMDGVLPAVPETFLQIYQEADRLEHLVSDLQELSRVEGGAYTLNLQPIPPERLLNGVAGRLSWQFEEKGVTLRVDPAKDLPLVMADEERIGQVLMNLVGNALQYTPPGGSVNLSAVRREKEVAFVIRDTGIGIAAEHLPHLFDRFYRVDKSRSRAGGGTGIGLTIAKHLVEAHGGRLTAESAGEGLGSTFIFTLPITKA